MKTFLVEDATLQYAGRSVVERLNWHAEAGKIYSIIGPNGCGKSTLLKALAGQLKLQNGSILLNGNSLSGFAPRQLARELTLLLQSQDQAPDMTVRTLVGYGRFPHKPAWGPMRKEDEAIVDWALEQTGTQCFASRKLSELSGGERQRVWIAMALAQQSRVLLLDEPTTFLDVSHQLEILELVSKINRQHSVTFIMVLHDINHAAAYSDEIAVMRQGGLYACGKPEATVTTAMLADVFGVEGHVDRNPKDGRPFCFITGLLRKTGPQRQQPERAEPIEPAVAVGPVGE
ncbi:Petrobactin import ATP-binding protein FpuC [Paenibacillus solanacearum]|uniref:Petrobactin import ATP-binding protein FpuC n=1 Tax=Paenibacillus solanacearum TaxID=2048548 RepID=A0A916K821_9BACL|nr:ABC transporter ATP-binding protein [Paenibacillus solanacearum]CAG7648311.1 Petrobactin import ATP-binding protein FpuC [Paenibacillus solanacearum]